MIADISNYNGTCIQVFTRIVYISRAGTLGAHQRYITTSVKIVLSPAEIGTSFDKHFARSSGLYIKNAALNGNTQVIATNLHILCLFYANCSNQHHHSTNPNLSMHQALFKNFWQCNQCTFRSYSPRQNYIMILLVL